MIKHLLYGGLAVLGMASAVAAADSPASLMAQYAQQAGAGVRPVRLARCCLVSH